MKKFSVLLVLIVALLYSCDKKNAGPGNGGGDDENKEILLPTVTTIEVVDITATSAICIAEVENAGAAEVTERGVEYACASFSEPDHDCYMGKIDAGSGLGEFQCEMTDLYPGETIYVRAFATNKAGTSYGEEISFVTLEEGNDEGNEGEEDAEKPTVKTASVVDVTSTSATVNAIVENDGGTEVTKRGVEYACASFSEPDNDCDVKIVDAGSGVGEFQCEMTDLNPNETYYVRAFATNKAGTSYGEEISFVTLEEGNDEGNEGEEDEETKINGYEYVDLGLPSGLKWASYNVGATSQYEVGEYFSWGELKVKDRYSMDNCSTYGVPMGDFSGDAEYDVAAFAWGSTWRMPTEAEVLELKNNCTMEWVMIDNDTQGCFVTGPNGNQIYLPSGGFMTETNVDFADSEAAYWTSSPDNNEHDQGYATFFYVYNNNFCNRGWMSRYVGMPIRPVSE